MKEMSIHLKAKPMTCRDTESNRTGRAAPNLRSFANKLNISSNNSPIFLPTCIRNINKKEMYIYLLTSASLRSKLQ